MNSAVADGDTRLKSMEENVLKVEDTLQQLQQFATEQEQRIENLRSETRKQFEQLTETVCTLMAKSHSQIGSRQGDGRLSVQESRRPQKRQQTNDLGQQCQYSMEKRNSVQSREGNFRFPKIDFPVFDGIKPRHWIRKSEKYFGIFAIPESQKLEIAAMYVNGKADVWLNGFLMQKPDAGWKEFSEALCARFGDKIDVEVVEEFNKLEQKGNLDEYTEQFEELKSCMLTLNLNLSESYFVSSYISGLKAEIKPLVKLGRPDSLASAFEHARLYTVAVDAIIQKSKASPPSRFQRKKGVNFSS